MRIYLTLLIVVLVLPGCVLRSYQSVKPVEGRGFPRISRDAVVLVAVARDGKHEHKIYVGSGAQTTAALVAALHVYTDRVASLDLRETRDDYVNEARARQAAYLVLPEIELWEERSWTTSMPDQTRIHLIILEVASGKTMSSSVAYARSIKAGRVENLLPPLFEEYASAIYAGE